MRIALVLAAATLWAGSAFADEPAACYVAKDPTGDFVQGKVQPFNADPDLGGQITHALNESNRAAAKCMESFVRREGNWPAGGAALLFGARISPAGKVTQASVLGARNINDSMLMACIGRIVCSWELGPSADGQEHLVALPPHVIAAGYSRRPSVGID